MAEPKGLDMSLDEIIKEKSSTHQQENKRTGVKCFDCGVILPSKHELHEHKAAECSKRLTPHHGQGKPREIICYTCQAGGARTIFSSMRELNHHKSSVHGQVTPEPASTGYTSLGKRRREGNANSAVRLSYTFSQEGDIESFIARCQNVDLVKVTSSGDVFVYSPRDVSEAYIAAYNMCLLPTGLSVLARGDGWKVCNTSGWSQDLTDSVYVDVYLPAPYLIFAGRCPLSPVDHGRA